MVAQMYMAHFRPTATQLEQVVAEKLVVVVFMAAQTVVIQVPLITVEVVVAMVQAVVAEVIIVVSLTLVVQGL